MTEPAELLLALQALRDEQAGVVEALTETGQLVAEGRPGDPARLRRAIEWQESFADVWRRVGEPPAQTLDALEQHLREMARAGDPRRAVLQALADATSEVSVTGLTEMTGLARAALDALDQDKLEADQYEPLEAIHQLLTAASDATQERVNTAIPLIVRAGIPPSLVILDSGAIRLGPAEAMSDAGAAVGPDRPPGETLEQPISSRPDPITQAQANGDGGVSRTTSDPIGREPESAEPGAMCLADPGAVQPAEGAPDAQQDRGEPDGDAASGAGESPLAEAEQPEGRGDVRGVEPVLTGLLGGREPLLAEWLVRGQEGTTAIAICAIRASWELGEQRDAIHEELEAAFQKLLSEDLPDSAVALLAASAALMAAPVAPRGLAATIARQAARKLDGMLPELANACARVAAAAESGEMTAARSRRGEAGGPSRAEVITRLEEHARELLARLPRERSTYVPASRVLHIFLQGRGQLALVLQAVIDGNIAELERLVARLDDREVRRLIAETFAAIDKKNRPLEAHARQWILDRAARVLALGRERLEAERGSDDRPARTGATEAIRDELVRVDRAIRTELEEQNVGLIGAAAELCRVAWETLQRDLAADVRDPRPFRSRRQLLRRFACLGLPLDDDGYPVGADGLPKDRIEPAEAARALEADLREAAEASLARLDLVALDLVSDGIDPDTADRLSGRADAAVAEERRLLVERRRRLELRLTRLIRSAALEPRIEARISTLFDLCNIDTGRALAAYALRLDLIEAELTAAAKERAAAISSRLSASRPEPEDTTRVQKLLAEEQFDVADEYLQLLERGERLPPRNEQALWLEEFISTIDSLEASGQSNVLNAFERRERIGAVDFGSVAQALRGEVLQAMTQLKTLKSPAALKKSALAIRVGLVLLQLGFDLDEPSIEIARKLPKATVMELSAHPSGAAFLPPEFGSAVGHVSETGARSRLAIIVARGTVNDREVIDLVRKHGGARRGTLVLLPDEPASLERRRQLARVAREQRAVFLLVDEYALINQALARSRRPGAAPLDITLETSLPFCWLNPYVHTGSVPPEMFFGRRSELQELESRTGSCFIFGGRQLGKSAMLRTLRRRDHHPDSGRVCVLLDLMAHGIGERKPGDQLWGVISAQLDEMDVGTAGPADRDSVVARIRNWVLAEPTRQLRLLLDECDLFLEHEALPVGQGGQNFANVLALRNLMDDTERRFKVVLAGLHSVNRFRRIPNFPLAQFGRPAPIGPLGWEDARELVERPLRTAGFRFDPPDLVDRMLVETRRHPSLVQFACDALIQRFFERRGRRASPPFVLHAADLDDLFDRSQDLRDRIKERFEWTLDLDKRYRVLALMIAMTSLDDLDARTTGMAAADLHEQAVAWWPAGFSGLDADAFEVLLEEMVSLEVLGVLDGKYRLPATNLLRMLGDQDEVTGRLEKEVDDEAPPQPVAPDELRRDLDGREAIERSPLTFRDERTLLREEGPAVRFVVGTDATLVDRVEKALGGQTLGSEWPDVRVKIHPPTALRSLARQVAASNPGDDIRLVHVVRVPAEASSRDIEAQAERFRAAAERTRVNRPLLVLVLDGVQPQRWPRVTRTLTTDDEDSRVVTLRRWGRTQIGALLNDLNIPAPGPEQLNRITEMTAGWPVAVEDLAERLMRERKGLDAVLTDSGRELTQRVAPSLTALELPHAREIVKMIDDWGSALDALSIAELLPGDVTRPEVEQVLEVLVLQQILDEAPGGYVLAAAR